MEVDSDTILPEEIRKALNRQPNFIPKGTVKRRGKKSKISKERNHKDLSRNK